MAIFHSHIQVISRGKGKSAVAAAAYRAGEIIKSEYDGLTHDYSRKGGVIHTEILLPANAPAEYADRSVLWNAVEANEKAANSRLARELDIALPAELTIEQNISLARRYVQDTFVKAGMCADLCVHDKGDGNPHFHVMLTTRPINEDGSWGGKQRKEYILNHDGNKIYDSAKRQYKCRSIPSTDWDNKAKADEWREAWEEAANTELERLGFDSRIDRRSYAEQGIELVPTVHMGAAAMKMERRGIRTFRGDINRQAEITNKEIWQLKARIAKLGKWLAEETAKAEVPTLADVISDILNRQGQPGITRLKAASQMMVFLQENDIKDFAGLTETVKTMSGKAEAIRADLVKTERRIKTLDTHLLHCENFRKHRKIRIQSDKLFAEYEALAKQTGLFAKPKAEKALQAANDYCESHRPQLALFNNAEKYLRDVLQGRFDPKKLPIAKWQEERNAKTIEKDGLYREYCKLKDETAKVERIRKSTAKILIMESQEQTIKKSQGMVL